MINRKFGNLDTAVPVIGQGSWQFPTETTAIEEAKHSLRLGIEHGMVHIDTAEMYGESEVIIGEAIKGLKREDLFIVSKVLPSNASFGGTIKACERSLKRLGTDYLDCYLLHWRGAIPLKETISALEKLIDDGKIRSLGVSNFDVYDLEEAHAVLSKHKITCNQVLYNIYTRGIEWQLDNYCEARDIAIVGYTPFGQKKLPEADTKSGAVLASIAQAHEATPRQIMLAFLTRRPSMFTIPKAARPEHTVENARAGDIELTEAELKQIDEVFPAPDGRVPLQML